MQRHPHIDDFVLLEVDFRRTPRAFDDHHIVLRPQRIQRLGDGLPQGRLGGGEIIRGRLRRRTPQQHHLGAVVGFGLQQDGVHFHLRVNAAGFGLHRLRPPQFAAAGGDE